jgi:hypothetical protein
MEMFNSSSRESRLACVNINMGVALLVLNTSFWKAHVGSVGSVVLVNHWLTRLQISNDNFPLSTLHCITIAPLPVQSRVRGGMLMLVLVPLQLLVVSSGTQRQ